VFNTDYSFTIPASVTAAKSNFIKSSALLAHVSKVTPTISGILNASSDLVGTETVIRFYASRDGSPNSEFPLRDDAKNIIEAEIDSTIGEYGVEFDLERAIRWPHIMIELRSASAPVPKAGGDRVVELVANDL
jgi:hypothetical protein